MMKIRLLSGNKNGRSYIGVQIVKDDKKESVFFSNCKVVKDVYVLQNGTTTLFIKKVGNEITNLAVDYEGKRYVLSKDQWNGWSYFEIGEFVVPDEINELVTLLGAHNTSNTSTSPESSKPTSPESSKVEDIIQDDDIPF